MDTIRDKLIKIMALAESGIEGEKKTAKRMLRELCRKYHVHPDTLLSPDKTIYTFRHRGGKDKDLVLLCCMFIVGRDVRGSYSRRFFKTQITKAQAIDIADMIRHYRKAWRSDFKDFWIAFVHRHSLCPPASGSESSQTIIDPERLARLLALMQGIQSETWIRPTARLSVGKP